MNTAQVIPFKFEAREVRTLLVDDQPWFVANDVGAALQYSEASAMTRHLDEDEKGLSIVQTPGGEQEMLVINESGLYSAILRSRKAEAKRFKKWVTAEVLPAIRRTGQYQASAFDNGDGSMVVAADEDFIHLNYDRRALLVYRRGDSFWYRAGNIAALVGVTTETIMRAAGADVLRVKSGGTANSVVTMIGHRTMLASLGRLRRADADALLQWLKLLLPGAFAPMVPALEAAPVATQPAPAPLGSLHYPVEVLPQMNPHAYRPLPANAVDPRIVMPVRALCGMDSRSPTLDLLSKLTSAGFEMEGCRLEVLAMRGLLENYISISRDMARMWEHRDEDCMVFKLSEAARQMRAQGGSRF